MPVIPTGWRWRREDQKLRVILSYRGSLRPAWIAGDLISTNDSHRIYPDLGEEALETLPSDVKYDPQLPG